MGRRFLAALARSPAPRERGYISRSAFFSPSLSRSLWRAALIYLSRLGEHLRKFGSRQFRSERASERARFANPESRSKRLSNERGKNCRGSMITAPGVSCCCVCAQCMELLLFMLRRRFFWSRCLCVLLLLGLTCFFFVEVQRLVADCERDEWIFFSRNLFSDIYVFASFFRVVGEVTRMKRKNADSGMLRILREFFPDISEISVMWASRNFSLCG